MYCSNCGKEIPLGYSFCGFCGEAAASPSHSSYGLAGKNEELRLMDSLISYFSAKKQRYEEYDNIIRKINELSCGYSNAALVWGILLSCLATLLAALAIPTFTSFLDQPIVLLSLAMPTLSCFIGGCVLIFVYIRRNKNRDVKLKNAVEVYIGLLQELTNYYNAYRYCPIGIEYSNPSNLLAIRRVLQSSRAYTFREALNMLIEYNHRRGVEDPSAKTAEYVKSTNRLAKAAVIISVGDLFT